MRSCGGRTIAFVTTQRVDGWLGDEDVRSAWQVRAGREGERDEAALDEGLIIVGWDEVADLRQYQNRDALRRALRDRYPDRSVYVIGNWTGQLWRFAHEIAEGDHVVMPLKSQGQLAIGEVTGPYEYRDESLPGFQHVRPVRWLRTEVDRAEFGADLRSSLTSLLTVCQLTRHRAPERIAEIARSKPDPGWRHKSASVDPDATQADLWEAVSAGAGPVKLTVRELLAKWNFSRRTATSQSVIQSELSERGVATRPSFTTARMDSVVELVAVAAEPTASDKDLRPAQATAPEEDLDEADELPVKWLVSAVLPNDRGVESVVVGSSLAVAVTRMLATNYSQLAVVNELGDYAGAVGWESIGRARLARADATLEDATVQVRVVQHDDDLFAQLDEIFLRGYVLVRGDDGSLIGVVTAHDLARQFGALARPFSLVEEAELRMRRQVMRVLPEDLIAQFAPKWGSGIPTFGGYGKLLQDREVFHQLGWQLDHETFLELVDKVKSIRNELMHFSQDTLPARDLETIEGFVSMLRTVDR